MIDAALKIYEVKQKVNFLFFNATVTFPNLSEIRKIHLRFFEHFSFQKKIKILLFSHLCIEFWIGDQCSNFDNHDLTERPTNDDACRDGVEHGEDADAHDELLQLVGLAAVLLHEGADLDEGEQAHRQEDCPDAAITIP